METTSTIDNIELLSFVQSYLHLAGKNVNIEVKDGVAVVRIDQPDSKVIIKKTSKHLPSRQFKILPWNSL